MARVTETPIPGNVPSAPGPAFASGDNAPSGADLGSAAAAAAGAAFSKLGKKKEKQVAARGRSVSAARQRVANRVDTIKRLRLTREYSRTLEALYADGTKETGFITPEDVRAFREAGAKQLAETLKGAEGMSAENALRTQQELEAVLGKFHDKAIAFGVKESDKVIDAERVQNVGEIVDNTVGAVEGRVPDQEDAIDLGLARIEAYLEANYNEHRSPAQREAAYAEAVSQLADGLANIYLEQNNLDAAKGLLDDPRFSSYLGKELPQKIRTRVIQQQVELQKLQTKGQDTGEVGQRQRWWDQQNPGKSPDEVTRHWIMTGDLPKEADTSGGQSNKLLEDRWVYEHFDSWVQGLNSPNDSRRVETWLRREVRPDPQTGAQTVLPLYMRRGITQRFGLSYDKWASGQVKASEIEDALALGGTPELPEERNARRLPRLAEAPSRPTPSQPQDPTSEVLDLTLAGSGHANEGAVQQKTTDLLDGITQTATQMAALGDGFGPFDPETGDLRLPIGAPLYALAHLLTGPGPITRRAAGEVVGLNELFPSHNYERSVQQYFKLMKEGIANALQRSPRYAQSEHERIEQKLDGLKGAFLKPTETLQDDLIGLDAFLETRMGFLERSMEDPNISQADKSAFAIQRIYLENVRRILGVPKMYATFPQMRTAAAAGKLHAGQYVRVPAPAGESGHHYLKITPNMLPGGQDIQPEAAQE